MAEIAYGIVGIVIIWVVVCIIAAVVEGTYHKNRYAIQNIAEKQMHTDTKFYMLNAELQNAELRFDADIEEYRRRASFCQYCGLKLEDDKFCTHCGAPTERI